MMNKIDSFIQGMTFSEFTNDEKTNFAVFRAIEIIGEAARNIPHPIIKAHSGQNRGERDSENKMNKKKKEERNRLPARDTQK